MDTKGLSIKELIDGINNKSIAITLKLLKFAKREDSEELWTVINNVFFGDFKDGNEMELLAIGFLFNNKYTWKVILSKNRIHDEDILWEIGRRCNDASVWSTLLSSNYLTNLVKLRNLLYQMSEHNGLSKQINFVIVAQLSTD